MNSQNDALNEPVYIKGRKKQKIRSKKCPFILLLTYPYNMGNDEIFMIQNLIKW